MQKESLEQRLHKHPALGARLEALLDMVEDESGQFKRADDAEEFLVSQMRSLGQELLQKTHLAHSLRHHPSERTTLSPVLQWSSNPPLFPACRGEVLRLLTSLATCAGRFCCGCLSSSGNTEIA
jgi:hypothetical protein